LRETHRLVSSSGSDFEQRRESRRITPISEGTASRLNSWRKLFNPAIGEVDEVDNEC